MFIQTVPITIWTINKIDRQNIWNITNTHTHTHNLMDWWSRSVMQTFLDYVELWTFRHRPLSLLLHCIAVGQMGKERKRAEGKRKKTERERESCAKKKLREKDDWEGEKKWGVLVLPLIILNRWAAVCGYCIKHGIGVEREKDMAWNSS